MSGHSALPQEEVWGLALMTSVAPPAPGDAQGALPARAGDRLLIRQTGGGGRSAWREHCGTRASSAAIRTACCWMTASSWTTTRHTTSGVWSQLVVSSGSPTANMATTSWVCAILDEGNR